MQQHQSLARVSPQPRNQDNKQHGNTSQMHNMNNQSNNAPPTNIADSGIKREFKNIKSHGKQNAVEVAPDITTGGWHTLRLEGAQKHGNANTYDWKNKVAIQVTKTELPVVIGTLLGYYRQCEYKNHGAGTDKWFSLTNQGSNFFFRIGQTTGGILMPTPVPVVEAHLMGMLGLSQYIKNFEGMSADAALDAIKTMCAHMTRNNKTGGRQQHGNQQ
jgi:hypothetical protein